MGCGLQVTIKLNADKNISIFSEQAFHLNLLNLG